jgi:hypothetical protein
MSIRKQEAGDGSGKFTLRQHLHRYMEASTDHLEVDNFTPDFFSPRGGQIRPEQARLLHYIVLDIRTITSHLSSQEGVLRRVANSVLDGATEEGMERMNTAFAKICKTIETLEAAIKEFSAAKIVLEEVVKDILDNKVGFLSMKQLMIRLQDVANSYNRLSNELDVLKKKKVADILSGAPNKKVAYLENKTNELLQEMTYIRYVMARREYDNYMAKGKSIAVYRKLSYLKYQLTELSDQGVGAEPLISQDAQVEASYSAQMLMRYYLGFEDALQEYKRRLAEFKNYVHSPDYAVLFQPMLHTLGADI